MKIAFCFLVYDNIIRYDIWNKFFEGCDQDKYKVFIHPKYKNDLVHLNFKFTMIKNIINTTAKDNITIVKATLQLLRESYSDDITHYIFVSQSCIPLYSFNIIYNFLGTINKSIVSCIMNNKKERYHKLSETMKKYIKYPYFVKQQPNMILINSDVKILIKNDMTEHFKYMQCPDEHYFINLLLFVMKKEIIKQQINFCNYNFQCTQAIQFNNVDEIFIRNIRMYGFLFLRKVNIKSKIDINYLFNN